MRHWWFLRRKIGLRRKMRPSISYRKVRHFKVNRLRVRHLPKVQPRIAVKVPFFVAGEAPFPASCPELFLKDTPGYLVAKFITELNKSPGSLTLSEGYNYVNSCREITAGAIGNFLSKMVRPLTLTSPTGEPAWSTVSFGLHTRSVSDLEKNIISKPVLKALKAFNILLKDKQALSQLELLFDAVLGSLMQLAHGPSAWKHRGRRFTATTAKKEYETFVPFPLSVTTWDRRYGNQRMITSQLRWLHYKGVSNAWACGPAFASLFLGAARLVLSQWAAGKAPTIIKAVGAEEVRKLLVNNVVTNSISRKDERKMLRCVRHVGTFLEPIMLAGRPKAYPLNRRTTQAMRELLKNPTQGKSRTTNSKSLALAWSGVRNYGSAGGFFTWAGNKGVLLAKPVITKTTLVQYTIS